MAFSSSFQGDVSRLHRMSPGRRSSRADGRAAASDRLRVAAQQDGRSGCSRRAVSSTPETGRAPRPSGMRHRASGFDHQDIAPIRGVADPGGGCCIWTNPPHAAGRYRHGRAVPARGCALVDQPFDQRGRVSSNAPRTGPICSRSARAAQCGPLPGRAGWIAGTHPRPSPDPLGCRAMARPRQAGSDCCPRSPHYRPARQGPVSDPPASVMMRRRRGARQTLR